jgi:hypothetical protein
VKKLEFNVVKTILEDLINQERFNGNTMYSKLESIVENNFSSQISIIKSKLDENDYSYVITSLLRNVFLIELVNDEISSTKMEVRWIEKESNGKKQEKFDNSDPRFCSFDECTLIFKELLEKLANSVQDLEKTRLLHLYCKYSLLPYEIPLDYIKIPVGSERIHCLGNLAWIWNKEFSATIELREILMSNNSENELFSKILQEKIKVKTYLTDRVQTGEHKTNREKRWETHPESVHFALRKEALLIERKLVSQLCYFDGFPKAIFDIVKEKIIPEEEKYRCPITLDPLKFVDFKNQIETPTHGKSGFPVGHLNPLKLKEEGLAAGHTHENIGWFSEDGNRIQGSLSLEETKKVLGRIYNNYFETKKQKELNFKS